MSFNPKLWLIVSLTTVVVCALIIALIPAVWGIDFVGGSLIEASTASTPDVKSIRELLSSDFMLEATVQPTENNSVLIRTTPLAADTHETLVTRLTEAGLITEELRFESIGPTIGQELQRKAWWAISLSILVMIAYLAYVFRRAGGLIAPWKFGVAAVGALAHDLLVVTAIFALLGYFFGVSIDTLFVTAMLAILGYSVNDSIVLFNRIKTEWLATRNGTLRDVIERSINATLIRSLNTSITTLLVLVALLLLGGTTIRWFVLALAAGAVVGTYSSLFVAPPLLYYLARKR